MLILSPNIKRAAPSGGVSAHQELAYKTVKINIFDRTWSHQTKPPAFVLDHPFGVPVMRGDKALQYVACQGDPFFTAIPLFWFRVL